jgi:hypothetical protein
MIFWFGVLTVVLLTVKFSGMWLCDTGRVVLDILKECGVSKMLGITHSATQCYNTTLESSTAIWTKIIENE